MAAAIGNTFVFADNAKLESDTGTIYGGGAVDTLDYTAYTSGIVVNLAAGTATGTAAISGLEIILGGSGNDLFTAGTFTATLTGGTGDDTYTFLNGFGNITVVELVGGGTDTLDFSAVTSPLQFTIGTTVTDGTHTVTHTGNYVENLTGGSAADTFVFGDGIVLAGSVDGRGGNDTLDLHLYTTGVTFNITGTGAIDGFAGFVTSVLPAFQNINTLIGGSSADDTLTGYGTTTTWLVTSTGLQYTAGGQTLTYSGIEHVGSGGDDTYVFMPGGIYTGTLDGGAGYNTLNYASYGSAISVTLTGLGSVVGFDGTGTGMTVGFTNMSALVGSALADTLTGANLMASWNLDGTDQYVSTNTFDFSALETLIGGTGADTFNISGARAYALQGGAGSDVFVLANGAFVTGTIDGGAGSDTLDESAFTTARTFTLTVAGTPDGFNGTQAAVSGGFGSINRILGSSTAATDLLTGANLDGQWQVGGALQTYTVGANVVEFAGFEQLSGGTGADTFTITGSVTVTLRGGNGSDRFVFNDGASLIGSVDGQGGDHNALDYSAFSSSNPVSLTLYLFTATTGGVTYNVFGIQDVYGGAGADRLVGDSGDNVIAGGTGNDYLEGRMGDDTFVFADGFGNVTLVELADGGEDTVDFSAVTGPLTFNIASVPTASLTVTDGSHTVTHAGNQVEHLIGGVADDSFVFADAAVVVDGTGTIDGSGGTHNTLNYAAYTTGVTVSLPALSAPGVSTFAHIQNAIGGHGNDVLIGDGVANVLTGNDGNDRLTGNGGNDTLLGGAGDDTYVFANGWGTDTVTDASGSDTFDLSGVTANVTHTINSGSVVVGDGTNVVTATANNIERLVGGSG